MKKIISIVIIIIVVIIFIFLFKSKKSNDLLGSWISEGGTIYEFNKNGKGVMIVPLSKYEFKYKIKDDKVSVDYISNKATDAKYTYKLKNKKLILKGEKGTFTFTKNKKNK